MALKILVLLGLCTLASSLPDPQGDGSDNINSCLFCGVDCNPSVFESVPSEQLNLLLLMQLSELPDYCDEPIPPPFNNPSSEDIEFRLTNSDDNYSRLITNDPASVDSSFLDSSLPLLVVVHGWLEDSDSAKWVQQIKDQWLEKMEVNVIYVEWKKLAAHYIYPVAVYNAKFVGTELAALLKFLKNYTGLLPSNTHIIGLSLGAHIAGVAGNHLENLGRITGLDPAGPLYNGAPLSERLDASDASFVDVIHTNRGGLGVTNKCGHVDFNMNGGYFQNECPKPPGDITISLCSHVLAAAYYIESLTTPEPRYGYICENQNMFQDGLCLNNAKNTVGYGVTPNPAGFFYSNTQ